MLSYRTVYPETLGLLKKLMKHPQLSDFFLVGGTALALQMGHRISIDLDMFTRQEFDPDMLLLALKKDFTIVEAFKAKNTLQAAIQPSSKTNNEPIKTDFIRYAYPLLAPIKKQDGIRLLSMEDLIPMKLSAITNRGSKKDFYDLFFLLKEYGLAEMLNMFTRKFPETNLLQVLKSLTYFEDAEDEPDPVTFEASSWNQVKQQLISSVKDFS